MTKLKLLNLTYVFIIIMAFLAKPTLLNFPKDSLVGVLVQGLSILLMIMFFIMGELANEKELKFLTRYSKVVKIIIVPYLLLTIWAILEIKEKFVGVTLDGSFYNL